MAWFWTQKSHEWYLKNKVSLRKKEVKKGRRWVGKSFLVSRWPRLRAWTCELAFCLELGVTRRSLVKVHCFADCEERGEEKMPVSRFTTKMKRWGCDHSELEKPGRTLGRGGGCWAPFGTCWVITAFRMPWGAVHEDRRFYLTLRGLDLMFILVM